MPKNKIMIFHGPVCLNSVSFTPEVNGNTKINANKMNHLTICALDNLKDKKTSEMIPAVIKKIACFIGTSFEKNTRLQKARMNSSKKRPMIIFVFN